MYQVDWVTGCPESWSNNVLDRSVCGVLDEINIQIAKQSKTTALPGMGGLFQSGESLRGTQGRARENLLFLPEGFKLGHWFPPASALQAELIPLALLGLRPSDFTPAKRKHISRFCPPLSKEGNWDEGA